MASFLLSGSANPEARSAVEQELLAGIPDLVPVSSLQRINEKRLPAERGQPANVIVLAPSNDSNYFERLIKLANHYRKEFFLILVSDEISGSDYKRLVQTGVADWASAKGGAREVLDIIARRRQEKVTPPAAAAHPDETGRVTISFVPAAGGVGNTTLVTEVAAYLKKHKRTLGRRICIVDLDFQTSHLCDFFDREPRLKIEELSGAPERLDAHLFDSFTTHHDSGIDIFAAPRSKFAAEALNIKALDGLFGIMVKRYDLILIDHPTTWFSWVPQVIAASDAAIITGLNTVPCLHQIAETLNQIKSADAHPPQLGIALNRCERGMFGVVARRRQAQRVLKDEQVFFISNWPEAVESVNMGIPMMLGPAARKVQKDFGPLADFCADVKSARVAVS